MVLAVLRSSRAVLRQSNQAVAALNGSRRLKSSSASSTEAGSSRGVFDATLNMNLEELDPEVYEIIEREKSRQRNSLCLIPSENFTSKSVLDALGSVMSNKYSEGYPNARYYGGNEWIDMSEDLCRTRALTAFDLDSQKWGVNVQALSGSPANLMAYSAVLKPHDRIMGLDLPHGGHLSHGFQIPGKKISMISAYFETLPYRLDETTGLIDYDKLEENAMLYRPKLIIAGASAYAQLIDYERMRSICDKVGAYLLADMAHISGLVSAGVVPTPFDYADIVTTTTHKSLRGPRGAMIFFRKGVKEVTKKGKEIMYDLENPINQSVFPGHQGGPHNHTICALAVALKATQTPEYVQYQKQVMSNSTAFSDALMAKGHTLVSGGTSNHLCLISLKGPQGVDGARVERILELANIAANKNTVPGDKSALVPGGLRVGTPALTSRGLVEEDFEVVADFIDRAVTIAKDVQSKVEGKKFADFKNFLEENPQPAVAALKQDVINFSSAFEVVGFDQSTMKYPN